MSNNISVYQHFGPTDILVQQHFGPTTFWSTGLRTFQSNHILVQLHFRPTTFRSNNNSVPNDISVQPTFGSITYWSNNISFQWHFGPIHIFFTSNSIFSISAWSWYRKFGKWDWKLLSTWLLTQNRNRCLSGKLLDFAKFQAGQLLSSCLILGKISKAKSNLIKV